jgi:orotate phosphoribosyltransferase
MGGVIVGYEMGRQLNVPAIFLERVDGKLQMRRGFTIASGARVLMVEDIVTTGLSSRECIAGIAEEGGQTVAAACLIDRSGGKADIGVPLHALTRLDVPTYPADALPPDLAARPAIKPGSRGLSK